MDGLSGVALDDVENLANMCKQCQKHRSALELATGQAGMHCPPERLCLWILLIYIIETFVHVRGQKWLDQGGR